MRVDQYLQVLVIFVVNTWTYADVCNDVDTAACQEMSKLNPNICRDACTRNVCKQFCGLCRITCYNCTEIKRPEDCQQTKVYSPQQSCVVTQTVTPSFEIAYDLNCADNKLCMDLYHKILHDDPTHHKRSIDLYGECCDSNLCNRRVPNGNIAQQTKTQATTQTVTPTHTNTMLNNTCADVSKSMCQKLINSSQLSCSDDCIAKLCPDSCNKCLTCFKCDFLTVSDIDKCNRTDVCSSGEECIISEAFSAIFTSGYKFGCSSSQKCHDLHIQKRSVSHNSTNIIPKGSCCNISYCNDKTFAQRVITLTSSMTKRPSVCDSNPCRNGATCDDHGGSLTCHCRPGFSGDKCEQNCSSCHRGTCNNLTYKTLCSCPRGYRGLNCNIDCHEDFGRAHCPPHFIKIAGLRSCYYFSTHTRRTWDNARGYCQTNHCSNLTVIENEDEEQKLSLYIQHNLRHLHVDENNHDINKGAYFWLDGRRRDAGYDWFWSSSGEKISYHKWHPGTPDDIGNLGDCIAYGPAEGFESQHNGHIYYWNDRACNVQLLTICEYIPDRF